MSTDFLKEWATKLTRRVKDAATVFSGGSHRDRTVIEKLLQNTFFQFLAFLAFIAALVAIVTTGFESQGMAPDRSMIGKPAQYDIRATHDFSFTETNLQASERARQEAARTVPPVFDWHEGRGEAYRDRLAKAFSSLRDALAKRARGWLKRNDPTRLEAIETNTPQTMRQQTIIEALPEDKRVGFARELREEHFSEHLKSSLSDAGFDALARFGFAPAAENALADILSQVMNQAVVANEDLPRTEGERGIYLRRLRGDKLLIEYHVTDIGERLVAMRDVPSLVREAAPQALSTIQTEQIRSAIISSAIALVQPNTAFNKAKTHAKREAARKAVANNAKRYEFSKGQIIVDRGHIITERHYRIIQKMYEEDRYLTRIQIVAGTVFLALLLIVTIYSFGTQNIREFRPNIKDVFFTATTLLLFLLIAQISVAVFAPAVAEELDLGTANAWYYLTPVAAAGMLIRLVLNNEHAIVFTIVFSILVGVVADNSLFFAAYTALGTLAGVATVQQVKHRMALMWSGVTVGAVHMASILAFLLIRGEFFQSTATTIGTAMIGLGGGLLTGAVVLAFLPVFEALFGYTTDIKLLELANLNHPLLRQLILRAPGSYHHSMMVGSLCEAGAESVGANPLLARVGAYYHDIGKSKNPQYFAENQKPGENPHDKIKPNMSALIIKNHVKDGLEMARRHRLPQEIQDFIAQHHGTSLISYFYHRAKQMEDPDIPEVSEEDYRYPGPKPQTRETAICMLADGIEAASRAMRDPTPARLKGLVQKMINKAFTDGQLDECDLTLRDLNKIAKALTRILTGIFHHRPEYPEQDKERDKRAAQANSSTESSQDDEDEPALERDADEPMPAHEDSDADESEESDTDHADSEGPDDGRRDTDEGEGEDASEDRDSYPDDTDEGRESLPRLGSR